jgi:hypothetical protein
LNFAVLEKAFSPDNTRWAYIVVEIWRGMIGLFLVRAEPGITHLQSIAPGIRGFRAFVSSALRRGVSIKREILKNNSTPTGG